MILASLRVRIGLWYALFTLSCLALFGAFLLLYLSRALEASRAPTMKHRTARLAAFVNGEYALDHRRQLDELLRIFLAVSPETDEVIVREVDGGRLLFHGGAGPELAGQASCSAPCFREFQLRHHHYRSYTENVVLAGIPVGLTLAGSVDEHYGILRTVLMSLLLFVPFLLIASLLGGYLLSSRSLAPVGRMTGTASRLSMSDLSGRVMVPHTGDELEALARAWNDMLDRLQSSVERSTHFISDASHDLRTSIAVMLASAQLALRRPRAQEEYTRTLATFVTECEFTLALLEELLATAHFGFDTYKLRYELLDLSVAVSERCSLFIAEAESKSHLLRLEVETGCMVYGDRLLLHRLIGVLVENAIKYTQDRGAITVVLRGSRAGTLLQVKDTGQGIAANDLSLIFARSYRGQHSRQRQPGSGLGLSIAQWIAEAHHTRLRATSQPGYGSMFEVEFNAPPQTHG